MLSCLYKLYLFIHVLHFQQAAIVLFVCSISALLIFVSVVLFCFVLFCFVLGSIFYNEFKHKAINTQVIAHLPPTTTNKCFNQMFQTIEFVFVRFKKSIISWLFWEENCTRTDKCVLTVCPLFTSKLPSILICPQFLFCINLVKKQCQWSCKSNSVWPTTLNLIQVGAKHDACAHFWGRNFMF